MTCPTNIQVTEIRQLNDPGFCPAPSWLGSFTSFAMAASVAYSAAEARSPSVSPVMDVTMWHRCQCSKMFETHGIQIHQTSSNVLISYDGTQVDFFPTTCPFFRCFSQPDAVGGHLELKVAWKVSQGRKEMPQQEEKIRKVGINFTKPYLNVFSVRSVSDSIKIINAADLCV